MDDMGKGEPLISSHPRSEGCGYSVLFGSVLTTEIHPNFE